MPVASAYAPDIVLVSAGFDACLGNPIGGMAVTPKGWVLPPRVYIAWYPQLCTLPGSRSYGTHLLGTKLTSTHTKLTVLRYLVPIWY